MRCTIPRRCNTCYVHVRVHVRESPYVCVSCDRAGTTRAAERRKEGHAERERERRRASRKSVKKWEILEVPTELPATGEEFGNLSGRVPGGGAQVEGKSTRKWPGTRTHTEERNVEAAMR